MRVEFFSFLIFVIKFLLFLASWLQLFSFYSIERFENVVEDTKNHFKTFLTFTLKTFWWSNETNYNFIFIQYFKKHKWIKFDVFNTSTLVHAEFFRIFDLFAQCASYNWPWISGTKWTTRVFLPAILAYRLPLFEASLQIPAIPKTPAKLLSPP